MNTRQSVTISLHSHMYSGAFTPALVLCPPPILHQTPTSTQQQQRVYTTIHLAQFVPNSYQYLHYDVHAQRGLVYCSLYTVLAGFRKFRSHVCIVFKKEKAHKRVASVLC